MPQQVIAAAACKFIWRGSQLSRQVSLAASSRYQKHFGLQPGWLFGLRQVLLLVGDSSHSQGSTDHCWHRRIYPIFNGVCFEKGCHMQLEQCCHMLCSAEWYDVIRQDLVLYLDMLKHDHCIIQVQAYGTKMHAFFCLAFGLCFTGMLLCLGSAKPACLVAGDRSTMTICVAQLICTRQAWSSLWP